MNGKLLIWISTLGIIVALGIFCVVQFSKGSGHAHCAQVQAILSAYRQEYGVWPDSLTEAIDRMTDEGVRRHLSGRWRFTAKRIGPAKGDKASYIISYSTLFFRYSDTFHFDSSIAPPELKQYFKR